MAKYIINRREASGLISTISVIKVTLDDDENGDNLEITQNLELISIASPVDMLQLPVDEADTPGGLFRTDLVSIITNGTAPMDNILKDIVADIKSNFKFQKEGYQKSFDVQLQDVCLPEGPCNPGADEGGSIPGVVAAFDPKIFVVVGTENPLGSSSSSSGSGSSSSSSSSSSS